MILPVALIIEMAKVCAPALAPETIVAIAEQESGRDSWAINDNATHQALFLPTRAEFVRVADERIREGHRLALGLMQVSTGNLGQLHLSAEDLANPCKSIAAGAAILQMFASYNCGVKWRPCMGYAQKVYAREHTKTAAQAMPLAPLLPPKVINPMLTPAPTGVEIVFNLR